jgi:heat shock protein HslJ
MTRLPVLLILTIGLLASCGRTEDAASGGAGPASGATGGDSAVSSEMVRPVGGDLRIGEPWYLVGGMFEHPPSTEVDVTITFDTTDVAGHGPINAYSTTYAATSEGGLQLGEWITTLAGGPDDQMRAEAELQALLNKVDGYTTVEAGELYLFDGDMNVLTYSAAPVTAEPTISDATQRMAEDLVGLPEDEAQAAVEGAGLRYRVVARDGQALAATDDYSATRINVAVEGGTVTEATIG